MDHGGDEEYIAKWLSNKTVENVRRWIVENTFLVAEASGTILGIAAMTPSGKITLNYVSPEARFRGVSKALIAALEDEARTRGIAECTLESTFTALAFYQSLGYVRTAQTYALPLTGDMAIVLAKSV